MLGADLRNIAYVIPASVSFELQLPEQVSTYNPAADWRGEIAAIVNSMYA